MKKKWKAFIRAIVFVAKDCPAVWPVTLLTAALEAAYPYINIILSAEILTEITSSTRDMERLLFLAALLVTMEFLGSCCVQFCSQLLNCLQYMVMAHLDESVVIKGWGMDYTLLCDPKIHEQQNTISHWFFWKGMVAMITQFRRLIGALVSIGISVALTVELFAARAAGDSMGARLVNHWTFPALFLLFFGLSTAYNIWSGSRFQKGTYQMEQDEKAPMNQAEELMKACCAEYQRGKDVRIFHAQGMLLGKFQELCEAIVGSRKKAKVSFRRTLVLSELLSRIFGIAVYLFAGLKTLYGAFGVGSLLKYTGMVTQFGDGIVAMVQTIDEMLQNGSYLADYFDYQDTKNITADAALPVAPEIREDYEFEFRHVTFTYPGAAGPSLRDISCKFLKGEKIAVVGRNGSGKTTFIKLLCRLYDPREGQILLNGVDIREYRYEEYLRFFSTVFQDYHIFAFTLGENVAAESDYSRKRAARALENAGFGPRLRTMPQGLDTQLFKNFYEDGVELSGGEGQKVALARCLYKAAPHAVLDEPTAALDAVAEADIYQRMNQFVQGKGAIYISHRLSSCHFCSRILVFDNGTLAETGTHEELLRAEGLYWKLWNAQAKYYQEERSEKSHRRRRF